MRATRLVSFFVACVVCIDTRGTQATTTQVQTTTLQTTIPTTTTTPASTTAQPTTTPASTTAQPTTITPATTTAQPTTTARTITAEQSYDTTTAPPWSPSTYVVMAAQALFPGQPYNVSVTILQSTAPVSVSATLQDTFGAALVTGQVTVSSGSAGYIVLQVPNNLADSIHSLLVVGSGGLNFVKFHDVYIPAKTLSIFVQTDKAVYTPSQTVLFRVLTLKPDLTPFTNSTDIAIYDPADNKLVEWLGQTSSTGVFSNSMVLSEVATPGKWTIQVTSMDNVFRKMFEVSVIEPSALKVLVDIPETYYVNLYDTSSQLPIAFNITAKHTYGTPVTGTADISVTVERYSWEQDSGYSSISTKFSKIVSSIPVVDGVAVGTVLGADLRDIIPCYSLDDYSVWSCLTWRHMFINVTVTETSSNFAGSSKTAVQCSGYNEKYTMTFKGMSPVYRPGFPLSGQLTLRQTNRQSLEAAAIGNTAVNISANCYDEYWNSIAIDSQQLAMPLTGQISFTIVGSNILQCSYYPYLQATYMDAFGQSAYGYFYLNVFVTRDSETIHVSLPDMTTTKTAGITARFLVSSTHELTSFSYQLLSRDMLMKAEQLSVSASTEHYLDIYIDAELSRKLAPSARLVVWFISSGGELVADSIDFSVVASTSTQVSVSFSSATVQPGSTVSITVRGAPNSYVGLLAVDKAAEKAPGNDIKPNTILADRFDYHNETRCLGSPDSGPSRRKREVVVTESASTDTSHVFFSAGILVLTDAYMRNDNPWDSSCTSLHNPIPDDGSNRTIDSIIAGFLETWLWAESAIGTTGTTTLQVTVPNLVRDWMLTAFAINPTTGLSVVAQPVNLTSIKSFFLTGVAPIVAVRTEEFGLQVTAHNLDLTTTITTVITLQASQSFQVRLPSEYGSLEATSTIEVPAASSVTTTFWIVPVVLGQIQFDLSGVGGTGNDAISVTVFIRPEGIAQEYSTSVSLSPSGGQTVTHTFNITLPPPGSLVPQSQHINVTAVGDFMGQTIDGLANLLRMPCGCGEQTMIGFAPDVYVLKYLMATDKATPEIEEEARTYILSGYQGELTYRHTRTDPYAFSAFGDSWWGNARGSVWLSAFVVKCFHQAREFIPLNTNDIATTITWILTAQNQDGSFSETGMVYHVDMQGLAANGRPLTAYVLVALLENADNDLVASLISTRAAVTIQYLEGLLSDTTVTSDPYLMNLICYALELAGSAQINSCLQSLTALATVSTADEMIYWQRTNTDCPSGYCWYYRPLAIDVEMTAYALLTYTHRQDMIQCAQIAKWLIAQRNSRGGFISTQDTVMALQALAEYATLQATVGSGQNIAVTLTAGTFTHTFDTITNSLRLQHVEIPENETEVQCHVSGTGIVILQMTASYRIYHLSVKPAKRRRRSVIEGSSSEFIHVVANQEQISDTELELTACASWSGTTESGMVMMEIGIPTGYSVKDPDQLRGEGEGRVMLVEVDKDNNQLNLYLSELIATDTCITANLTKVLPVSNVQTARVTVYLYYNPGERRDFEYESVVEGNETTHCDMCKSCCQCTAPDYFTCDGTCFAASAKCNGKRECSDGSDEVGCATTTPGKHLGWTKCRKRCRVLRRIRRMRARRRARRASRRVRRV